MQKITLATNILAFTVAAGLLLAAEESPYPYSPITRAEAWQAVARELRSRGFQEELLPRADDLELPVAVPARAGRNLRVSSVCWDADAERARFRIECREPGACLPFLAYLRDGAFRGRADFHPDARTGSPAAAPTCRLEARGHSSALRHADPLVRAGERATAVLTASGLRMTATVTCLDRGARGEIIRVRGEEGRIFRARVAGEALVEALPE